MDSVFMIFKPIPWSAVAQLVGIEGLLFRVSPPVESLCYVLEQEIISVV